MGEELKRLLEEMSNGKSSIQEQMEIIQREIKLLSKVVQSEKDELRAGFEEDERAGLYKVKKRGKHQVLAVAEIITRNLDVEVWEGSSSSLYKRRNHTDGSAAIRLYCLADAIHQTGVAAAENQVVAVLSHPLSHLFSQCEEVGVDILIC